MKVLSQLVFLCSLLVFVCVLPRSVQFELVTIQGLINPDLRLEVLVENQSELFAALVAVLLSGYQRLLVIWIEQRLSAEPALAAPLLDASAEKQGRAMRLIKDAIRSGNVDALRYHLDQLQVLPEEDDSRLTLMEMADLYGNSEIIALVQDAIRLSGGLCGADAPAAS